MGFEEQLYLVNLIVVSGRGIFMVKVLNEIRKEDDNYFCGPFWIIANSFGDILGGNFQLESIKYLCDFSGNLINDETSKSQKTHEKIWKSLKPKYNGVGWKYYPRGRVMILPIYGDNKTFKFYDVTVYIDKCIDTPEIRDYIEDEFRLYLKTCKVSYEGQLGLDGSHYVCHNCKG